MNLSIPEPVRELLQRFSQSGFEAVVVGGCVRDSLLGQAPHDWDIATSARPEQIGEALSGFRLLETGLKHGTVTALSGGMAVEITTYRVDGTYSDSRHPDSVTFTGSLKADLARRDFTVNAIAYSEKTGLADCFGGRRDLERRILRCVGEPARRFEEDALRILRGLRFAAVLGFSVEPETARSMRELKFLLGRIAKERISAELTKLLCGKDAPAVLREFPDVIGQVLPEILPMVGFDQHNPHHIYDVWEHTLHALGAIEPLPIPRLTMLLHDSGKPHTYTQDEKGAGHFYGHGKISLQLAEAALKRLRFDGVTIRTVCLLIRLHDTPMIEDEKWVRRQLGRIGEENFRTLISVHRADCLAQNPEYRDRLESYRRVGRILDKVLSEQQCFRLRDLAVNGRDLLALGFSPDKRLGETLDELLDAVIDGKCPNEKEALLRLAARKMK